MIVYKNYGYTQKEVDDLETCYCMVADFFEGDFEQVNIWYEVKNPMFGNYSANDMIKHGQFWNLKLFISESISGNIAPGE